jgi:putative ABC transport system substrate-binding protein
MDRRAFVAGSLSALAAPPAVEAQQRPSVARVAFLEGGNLERDLWHATRDGLRELGYVEGKNLIIEYRSASGQFDRVPELLAEMIRLRVDVIVTIGDPVVSAAKQATSTIPIVMAGSGDPAPARRAGCHTEPVPGRLPSLPQAGAHGDAARQSAQGRARKLTLVSPVSEVEEVS